MAGKSPAKGNLKKEPKLSLKEKRAQKRERSAEIAKPRKIG